MHSESSLSLYIYIYLGSISSLMQISLNIIDILCLHIFFWIHSNSRITFIVFGGELIYVLSIVVCIPSTFCPTLGHHQGRIYNKRDITFVLAYYYCVRVSLPLKIMTFACVRHKFNSSAFKKTFMPNNTTTKNSHRQHNNIRTSK